MKNAPAIAIVLAASLLSFAGSCGGVKPPDPTKPPTPPASTTRYDDLALGRAGRAIVNAHGVAFDFRGNYSCCFSEDGEPDPAWALATHAHLDRMKAAGFNVVGIRLGPYNALPDSPESLRLSGGPYVVTGGKADLTQWNPAFWTYVRDLFDYAGKLGIRFEVDVVDGWGCKLYGGVRVPFYHPWLAANNVQGLDGISGCGTGELVPGSIQEVWVRKVYFETVEFSNGMYQDGNEIDLVRNYSSTFTASAGLHLRDVEAIKKTKRHLFGTNAVAAASLPQVDYVTVHNAGPLDQGQCRVLDKPCFNNEYNPEPSYTSTQIHQFFCNSKSNGTYWWFWRHGMSKSEAERAWALMASGCGAAKPPGCSTVPGEDATSVQPRPPAKYATEVNAALRRLKPECEVGGHCPVSDSMQVFLQKVAEELRQGDPAAGIPALCSAVQIDSEGPVDEVCVGTETACQGYHAFACTAGPAGCTRGTVAWAPGSHRDTWVSLGAARSGNDEGRQPRRTGEPAPRRGRRTVGP